MVSGELFGDEIPKVTQIFLHGVDVIVQTLESGSSGHREIESGEGIIETSKNKLGEGERVEGENGTDGNKLHPLFIHCSPFLKKVKEWRVRVREKKGLERRGIFTPCSESSQRYK